MAVSGKDIETLWQRYQVDAVPSGISVNQFFESNGVPYHVFEKWYKKYINIGLSNGMKIEHHNLSYSSLQSFIQKLQSLCLA